MADLTIELLETEVKEVVGLPYLCLQLESTVTVAVPLRFIQETLVMFADRFTQMPNVNPCLMGLVEHRSSIFWVFDLPQLLGFTSIDSTAVEYPLAILQTREGLLGMAVRSIGRIVRFADDLIRSPEGADLPIAVVPFLRGWVAESDVVGADGAVYVLDTEAIAQNKFS
jgi:positive phototaxis protein PixI